jgi:MFS family permease
MTDRARRLYYLIALPMGHFSVDTPGGALWLVAAAVGAAWGLSPAEVGLIITAHNLGGGLGYLPSGFFAERFGRRGLLLTTTVWWVVVGYLAASYAPGYWPLLGLLMFAAMGDAAWHPMATGTLVEQMPRRRALALGVHLTGGIMAEVAGPLAVGFLLGFMDWRDAFRIAIIPALVFGVLLLYGQRHIRSSTAARISRADVGHVLAVWRTRPGVLMFGLGVAYSMAFVGLMAMTPLYFQDYHGHSSAWAGAAFAAMLFGGGLAAPFVGRLSDTWGRKRVVVTCALVGTGGITLTALGTGPVTLVAGVVIAGTVLVGVRPVYLAAAVEMVGRRETSSLGLIYAAMDGVGALGGVLAGLAGSADLRMALAFSAAWCLLFAVLALAHPFSGPAPESAEPAPA